MKRILVGLASGAYAGVGASVATNSGWFYGLIAGLIWLAVGLIWFSTGHKAARFWQETRKASLAIDKPVRDLLSVLGMIFIIILWPFFYMVGFFDVLE